MNRASRDLSSYITDIRSVLIAKGIQVRSATETFDDTPEGHFMESIHVLLGQLDNENKREMVVDNMTRFAQQGYWQHKPLRGYDRTTVRNEENKPRPSMKPNADADLIRDVLLRFNRGDILQAELVRYASSIGLNNMAGTKPLTQDVLHRMITCSEYAGYIHDKFTGYELVAGRHEGLISEDVYWQNQEILKRKKKAYLLGLKHNQINTQVPLLKFMLCVSCGKHMTSSNPGKYKVYRYYCARKSCRKTGSVTVTVAHERFEQLLAEITPTAGTLKLMKEILKRTSVKQLGGINGDLKKLRLQQQALDKTRLNALERAVNGRIADDDLNMLLDKLKSDKRELAVDIEELEQRQTISETSIEFALNFMVKPAKLWADASLELKIMLQNLVFPEQFTYDIKNEKFITTKISPLYRSSTAIKQADNDKNSSLVIPRGIEPRLPG